MIICEFAAVASSELDRSGGGMEDPVSPAACCRSSQMAKHGDNDGGSLRSSHRRLPDLTPPANDPAPVADETGDWRSSPDTVLVGAALSLHSFFDLQRTAPSTPPIWRLALTRSPSHLAGGPPTGATAPSPGFAPSAARIKPSLSPPKRLSDSNLHCRRNLRNHEGGGEVKIAKSQGRRAVRRRWGRRRLG
ncbi:hypothetical protein TIFTF001_023833 [Ficus carica]|uniref:Uncharacterized protein n=1 Tax=Ficus carica TaxID=3494 RepID=A0AA88AME6_FICCA|nr:hypothetical protein TIFTF001_023833 [Ficus carica]